MNRLTVCQPVEMTLAKGDQLQLKANAPSLDGKELINGELVTVAGVNRKGANPIEGRANPAGKLSGVRARLRDHVLRLARQNRRTRFVFGFVGESRDE